MNDTPSSMVIVDRDPDYEITINGNMVYDTHTMGDLPKAEIIALIEKAAGIKVTESDYIRAAEDGDLHMTAIAMRIAKSHGWRCWILDRAPYDDEDTSDRQNGPASR